MFAGRMRVMLGMEGRVMMVSGSRGVYKGMPDHHPGLTIWPHGASKNDRIRAIKHHEIAQFKLSHALIAPPFLLICSASKFIIYFHITWLFCYGAMVQF
jgi:hypothetical protein